MKRRDFLDHVRAGALVASAASPLLGVAQTAFPTRPVRIVVPFAPGGTTDGFARLFGTHFGKALGVPVVIDNKGGAGGLLGAAEVHAAKADGYTLCFQSPTSGITGPLTRKPPPFDPVTGFAHIAILGVTPVVIAVSNASGITSLRDLIRRSRANSGGLNFATGGVGGGPHLAVELLRTKAGGFDAVHAAYKGAGPALQDLIGNQVQYMADTFTTFLPLHKEGKLRIISVLGPARSDAAPEVLTAREEGFDVVANIANYLCAPPNTPADRISRLAQATTEAMRSPDITSRLKSLAYTPIAESGHVHATRFIAEEVAQWRPLIEAAGIELK